jgi:hypothetical protein
MALRLPCVLCDIEEANWEYNSFTILAKSSLDMPDEPEDPEEFALLGCTAL